MLHSLLYALPTIGHEAREALEPNVRPDGSAYAECTIFVGRWGRMQYWGPRGDLGKYRRTSLSLSYGLVGWWRGCDHRECAGLQAVLPASPPAPRTAGRDALRHLSAGGINSEARRGAPVTGTRPTPEGAGFHRRSPGTSWTPLRGDEPILRQVGRSLGRRQGGPIVALQSWSRSVGGSGFA
jgi:hypothetical protein